MRQLLAVALLTGSAACSSGQTQSATGFPAQALVVAASISQRLTLELRSAPAQPPTRGDVSLELTARDTTTGELASGLLLSVTPWMPAMGHGTSDLPSVEEASPGHYQLSNLVLYMAGTWELRTHVAGQTPDDVTPTFPVR